MRPLVFVSYSHENADWIKALRLDEQADDFENVHLWIDKNRIHTADIWSDEAEAAIAEATAAVLLVSKQFLKSEAIMDRELPALRKRYRDGDFKIVFVLIGPVAKNKTRLNRLLALPDVNDHTEMLSVPGWDTPLKEPAEFGQENEERRKEILSVTLPPAVQNLRNNIADKYKLQQVIGEGPLGCVIKAYDRQLERPVAVKMLHDAEQKNLFKKSVQCVSKIPEHSGMLSVYGAYLSAEPPHYVIRYVEGKSLRAILDSTQEPLPVEQAKDLLNVVGAAVEHAHRHGIYGLNIKASNIIIQEPDNPEETQYFLAPNSYETDRFEVRSVEKMNKKELVYLPFEYRDKSQVRKRVAKLVDQYCLGLLVYEMLVGTRRFAKIARALKDPKFDPVEAGWSWPSVANEREVCGGTFGRTVDRMIKGRQSERFDCIGDAVKKIKDVDLDADIVKASFRRLMATTDGRNAFLTAFYVRFQKECAPARAFFKDYGRLSEKRRPSQKWLMHFQSLKQAIVLLLAYKILNEDENDYNILTRIADSHATNGIPPELYDSFKQVLLETVLEMDGECDISPSQLKASWNDVITPGINYMKNYRPGAQVDPEPAHAYA